MGILFFFAIVKVVFVLELCCLSDYFFLAIIVKSAVRPLTSLARFATLMSYLSDSVAILTLLLMR